jgi:hypothetical protein
MEKLLLKIRPFIFELFSRRTFSFLKYHNFHHTETVVERAYEISRQFPLTQREIFSLITAAWFHDTGHLFNELADHEKVGADLMASYLKSFSLEEDLIDEIYACILATKTPTHPDTLIQKIICDADTYHFGTKQFFETDPEVYEELEERFGTPIQNKIEKSIHLLESHQYYTLYCQELLNNGKKENINLLKSQITKTKNL